MTPLDLALVAGGAVLLIALNVVVFNWSTIKGWFSGSGSAPDPIDALKQLIATTDQKVLSSTPVRTGATGVLVNYGKLIDALPNTASKTTCHAALRTLITEIGDPTPAASAAS
jgi:hypothetical protein